MQQQLIDDILNNCHGTDNDTHGFGYKIILELMSKIHGELSNQKILILTMSIEEIYAKRYLLMGVKGFVNKEASPAEIRKAAKWRRCPNPTQLPHSPTPGKALTATTFKLLVNVCVNKYNSRAHPRRGKSFTLTTVIFLNP